MFTPGQMSAMASLGKVRTTLAGAGGLGSVAVKVRKKRGNAEGGTRVVDVFIDRVKSSIAGDINRGAGPIPAALSGTYGLSAPRAY